MGSRLLRSGVNGEVRKEEDYIHLGQGEWPGMGGWSRADVSRMETDVGEWTGLRGWLDRAAEIAVEAQRCSREKEQC